MVNIIDFNINSCSIRQVAKERYLSILYYNYTDYASSGQKLNRHQFEEFLA